MAEAALIPHSIVDLASAIATAEGFGANSSNVPTRAHNPGDLKLSGYPTTGVEGIAVFPDDTSGWNALYSQLLRIKNNQSHVYKVDMTFTEFAHHWTDTQESSWLNNVLLALQEIGYEVNKDTTLEEYFSEEG